MYAKHGLRYCLSSAAKQVALVRVDNRRFWSRGAVGDGLAPGCLRGIVSSSGVILKPL